MFVPLWVACRTWRLPAAKVFLGCALVITGVALLAGLDWHDFRLGRGEWETLAAAVLFAGQILWLERPKYAPNNVDHFTFWMFAVMSLVALPVALGTTKQPAHWLQMYGSAPAFGFLAVLVVVCTLGAYRLMNRWQRQVTATQAGFIYCAEPLFASAFALFLPAWFSNWAAIPYPNETLTLSLLFGGAFITAANVIVHLPTHRELPEAHRPRREVPALGPKLACETSGSARGLAACDSPRVAGRNAARSPSA